MPRVLYIVLVTASLIGPAIARDLNGQWAANPLRSWFDSLSSQKGLCCSAYDGQVVEPDDWGTESVAIAGETQILYWVRINGQKVTVPPEAVVNVPNRAKTAIVWPYSDAEGKTQIRCFLAGPMI